MRLSDILARDRMFVDSSGQIPDKATALTRISEMIAPAIPLDPGEVETLLVEREKLQSNGIGEGVAIPHARVESAPGQVAALLLCPRGVPFDAIDNQDATIIFGVVGPKGDTAAHLRVLARISRLLRDPATRRRLLEAVDPEAVFALIQDHENSQ